MKLKLSIVIPCYNEEKDILECLKSLAGQNFQNFEILIIDDGSKDKSLEIINKFADKNKKITIRILKQNHKGPGLARNLGANNAKGKILVFIDADMTFDKAYLENLVKPILDDKTEKIIGTTHELEIVKNIDNIWSRCWGRVRVRKEDAKNMKVFRAIRKNKFLELGGFDPKYGYADDQTFWFKYKIKPVVAVGSVCYHKNPETLRAVFKQSRWIGASHKVNLIKIIGMIFLFPILIPILAIRKCYNNRDFIIFPAMLVFMTARYFGNISGYLRKMLYGYNLR